MKDKKIILIVIIGTLFLILGIILVITREPKVDTSGSNQKTRWQTTNK